jgi:hypothetical protein
MALDSRNMVGAFKRVIRQGAFSTMVFINHHKIFLEDNPSPVLLCETLRRLAK